MKRYEYHTETVAVRQVALVANQRGADGWRIHSVTTAESWVYAQPTVMVLFEREREVKE